MTTIEITRKSKCKDRIFITCYHPTKLDGKPSKLRRYQCGNKDSGRNNISPNDLVCDKWKLG